jgi:hypothetical protein
MNDDHLTIFSDLIKSLNPKAADFDFELSNLRSAVQISVSLTPMEKRELSMRLHDLAMKK